MTTEKELGTRISEMMAARGDELDEAERREAPRRARIEALRASTPRVIYRDPGSGWYGRGRPTYRALRLSDVRYVPKRMERFATLGDSRMRSRTAPATVRVFHSGSSIRDVGLDEIGEFVRRPTSKALRRLEEAEEELRRARLAVRDAERAAFTYGKPVTLSAVKEVSRAHSRAWNGEEE